MARRRSKRSALTARSADRHALYQESVQDPEHEVGFITRTFRRARGRLPVSLREDFCGTAFSSAAWVRSSPRRTATGLDLDRSVLAWGERHNRAPLGSAAERLTLVRDDVRRVTRRKFDVCSAMNFSYFCFRERDVLVGYFDAVRRSLVRDGMFFLDIYGGFEAQQETEDDRPMKGFTYVWEQAEFNPIDNSVVNHIHFRFKDGSRIRRAFTYHWRLWQPVEVREALLDAGFRSVDVYWEDEDEDGEGTGTFRRRTRAENGACWLAFLVASR